VSDNRLLLLYSTPACHLCEMASEVIAPYLQDLNIRVETVDISESDALIDLYGIRIPVLRFEGGRDELGWPFGPEEFLGFAAQAS